MRHAGRATLDRMGLGDIARAGASVLVPPRCGICTRPCAVGESACKRCRTAVGSSRPLIVNLPVLGATYCAGPYEGALRALIHALKFASRPGLAPLAARALTTALALPLQVHAVVPVPPASLRRRHRGFDPAELLAAALADELALPVAPCLRRLTGRRQVGRPRRERIADPPRIAARGAAPPRALLVDDVVTTGATLSACARALRAAGSAEVTAVALAHSLGGRPGST